MASPQDIFEQAYGEFSDAIFRHCAFRLRNRERGMELMQEAYVRLWTALTGGTQVENMRAFLYRIANNLVIDEVRKKKEVSLDAMTEAGWDVRDERLGDIQDHVQLQEILDVLATMDPTARQVLVMRYIDGMKPAEIAIVLDETANTVSVRLHRAVKELRVYLEKPHHEAAQQRSVEGEPPPTPKPSFPQPQADVA